MDTETLLRSKLEDWGVDVADTERTLWSNIHAFDDGFMSLCALDVDNSHERLFRIYRVFPVGNQAHLSVDVEISATRFGAADRNTLPFDNGERGDFTEWREAIRDELAGDFVFVWADEGEPYLSFVGRTVRVGGEERVVCGQCERKDGVISVQVDFDRSMAEVLSPAAKPAPTRGLSFA
jgi:hypothetical protein